MVHEPKRFGAGARPPPPPGVGGVNLAPPAPIRRKAGVARDWGEDNKYAEHRAFTGGLQGVKPSDLQEMLREKGHSFDDDHEEESEEDNYNIDYNPQPSDPFGEQHTSRREEMIRQQFHNFHPSCATNHPFSPMNPVIIYPLSVLEEGAVSPHARREPKIFSSQSFPKAEEKAAAAAVMAREKAAAEAEAEPEPPPSPKVTTNVQDLRLRGDGPPSYEEQWGKLGKGRRSASPRGKSGGRTTSPRGAGSDLRWDEERMQRDTHLIDFAPAFSFPFECNNEYPERLTEAPTFRTEVGRLMERAIEAGDVLANGPRHLKEGDEWKLGSSNAASLHTEINDLLNDMRGRPLDTHPNYSTAPVVPLDGWDNGQAVAEEQRRKDLLGITNPVYEWPATTPQEAEEYQQSRKEVDVSLMKARFSADKIATAQMSNETGRALLLTRSLEHKHMENTIKDHKVRCREMDRLLERRRASQRARAEQVAERRERMRTLRQIVGKVFDEEEDQPKGLVGHLLDEVDRDSVQDPYANHDADMLKMERKIAALRAERKALKEKRDMREAKGEAEDHEKVLRQEKEERMTREREKEQSKADLHELLAGTAEAERSGRGRSPRAPSPTLSLSSTATSSSRPSKRGRINIKNPVVVLPSEKAAKEAKSRGENLVNDRVIKPGTRIEKIVLVQHSPPPPNLPSPEAEKEKEKKGEEKEGKQAGGGKKGATKPSQDLSGDALDFLAGVRGGYLGERGRQKEPASPSPVPPLPPPSVPHAPDPPLDSGKGADRSPSPRKGPTLSELLGIRAAAAAAKGAPGATTVVHLGEQGGGEAGGLSSGSLRGIVPPPAMGIPPLPRSWRDSSESRSLSDTPSDPIPATPPLNSCAYGDPPPPPPHLVLGGKEATPGSPRRRQRSGRFRNSPYPPKPVISDTSPRPGASTPPSPLTDYTESPGLSPVEINTNPIKGRQRSGGNNLLRIRAANNNTQAPRAD